LLTHTGPSISPTTEYHRNKEPIYNGIDYLNNFFEENNIFLNLHGHIHDGQGEF